MALWLGEATGAGRLVAVTGPQTVSATHTHAAATALGPRSHSGSARSIFQKCVEILCEIVFMSLFLLRCFKKQLPSSSGVSLVAFRSLVELCETKYGNQQSGHFEKPSISMHLTKVSKAAFIF